MKLFGEHICVLTTNKSLAELVAHIHNGNDDMGSKQVGVVAINGSWALQRLGVSHYYAMVDWINLKVVGWETPNPRIGALSGPWMGDER